MCSFGENLKHPELYHLFRHHPFSFTSSQSPQQHKTTLPKLENVKNPRVLLTAENVTPKHTWPEGFCFTSLHGIPTIK